MQKAITKVVVNTVTTLLIVLSAPVINTEATEERNQRVFNQCIWEVYPKRLDVNGEITFQSAEPEEFMRCLRRMAYQFPEDARPGNNTQE